jgi:hypothetical protein
MLLQPILGLLTKLSYWSMQVVYGILSLFAAGLCDQDRVGYRYSFSGLVYHIMKEVLALIEARKLSFSKQPFLEFLRNEKIAPKERLSFTLCLSPFVMGFSELNKYVFRDETTSDPLQKLINKHTTEDDRHWLWFLEDIQALEIDYSVQFTDALKFLWSDETKVSRQVIHELYRYTFKAEPIQKFIVLQVVEATGNIFLSTVQKVSQELKTSKHKDFKYFGSCHVDEDSSHSIHSSSFEHLFENIELSNTERDDAFELVETIFVLFEQLTDALLAYSEKHSIDDVLLAA